MDFVPTPIAGAYVVRPERQADERGFFARTWCRREFRSHGLDAALVQCSVSFNTHEGTLRGLHYQSEPHPEVKLVRCARGRIFDAIVDLRPASESYLASFSVELTADNGLMLYVPEGCAHGFLTLESDTEVFYQMSEYYAPDSSGGVRWNDPVFGIDWPKAVRVIAPRDAGYPDYDPVGTTLAKGMALHPIGRGSQ